MGLAIAAAAQEDDPLQVVAQFAQAVGGGGRRCRAGVAAESKPVSPVRVALRG